MLHTITYLPDNELFVWAILADCRWVLHFNHKIIIFYQPVCHFCHPALYFFQPIYTSATLSLSLSGHHQLLSLCVTYLAPKSKPLQVLGVLTRSSLESPVPTRHSGTPGTRHPNVTSLSACVLAARPTTTEGGRRAGRCSHTAPQVAHRAPPPLCSSSPPSGVSIRREDGPPVINWPFYPTANLPRRPPDHHTNSPSN